MGTGDYEPLVNRLLAVVEPVTQFYGVELVELIYHPGRYQTVRVVVDKVGGVTIADCAAVSRRLSADLDAAEVMAGRYTLEVSSPGLDRPLRTRDDFRRKVGEAVTLRFADDTGRRRTAKGRIESVADTGVTVAGTEYAWNRVVEGKLEI